MSTQQQQLERFNLIPIQQAPFVSTHEVICWYWVSYTTCKSLNFLAPKKLDLVVLGVLAIFFWLTLTKWISGVCSLPGALRVYFTRCAVMCKLYYMRVKVMILEKESCLFHFGVGKQKDDILPLKMDYWLNPKCLAIDSETTIVACVYNVSLKGGNDVLLPKFL